MTYLNYLTRAEVEKIHLATLEVLSQVGVVLTFPSAVALLQENGARQVGKRMLFPEELVEGCLALCPRTICIKGRNSKAKTMGDGNLYFHNLGGARDIFDNASGQHRYAQVRDIVDSTRLLDALPNCHTITPFFTPQDVPGGIMSLAMYRHALPHTTKPVQGPGLQFASEARFAYRMAEVVGDPKEVLTLSVSPVSPLTFPDHEVDAIMEVARLGITFASLPCPTMGTTAPFSISGAIVQQNAELLASIVLVQLIHPGLPVIYCGRLAMMEPRTGISVWGGLELGLASAGTVQIGHRYGLPVNVYGFSTNSHTLDVQDGAERVLNAVIPALAGADELSGIGEMEAGVMGSLAQMVLDDELAGNVLRARRGFAVDDDALATSVIRQVMESDSHNYLGQKHTLKYLRNGEIQLTHLAERGTWESWNAQGRKGMAENAQEQAERIIKEHEVPGLDGIQNRELDKLIDAARLELCGE